MYLTILVHDTPKTLIHSAENSAKSTLADRETLHKYREPEGGFFFVKGRDTRALECGNTMLTNQLAPIVSVYYL
jgi:hypothetical protein